MLVKTSTQCHIDTQLGSKTDTDSQSQTDRQTDRQTQRMSQITNMYDGCSTSECMDIKTTKPHKVSPLFQHLYYMTKNYANP